MEEREAMKRLPVPISARNSAMAIVFGLSVLGMIVMITWRWLLE